VFDRDDEPWRSLGEGPFRRALDRLAFGQVRAVAIRAGASSSARARSLSQMQATHGFLLLPPPAVCHERVKLRGRSDVQMSHRAIVKWWSNFDHDDLLPEWPGSWDEVEAPNVDPPPLVRARKAAPASRGYGQEHRAMRRAVAGVVTSGQAWCQKCGKPIVPGDAWDLGHSDDRRSWTGPEHAACNRRHGALKRWEQHVDPPPPPGW
jgi:hypothetical protein